MDRREAKREACWIASCLLRRQGPPEYPEALYETSDNPKDWKRLEKGWDELVDELRQRGWQEPSND